MKTTLPLPEILNHMRPFIATFALTALTATMLWLQERSVVASLRASLSGRFTNSVAQEKPAVPTPVKSEEPSTATLQSANGSGVVTARSLFRAALESAAHIRSLGISELKTLIESGKQSYGFIQDTQTMMAYLRLAELDVTAALALCEGDEGRFVILSDWLLRDRTAALRWFYQNPDAKMKSEFIMSAGMILGSSEPALIAQLRGSLTDLKTQEDAQMLSIVSQSITDTDGAFARLSEQEDDQTRAQAITDLFPLHGTTKSKELLDLAMPMASKREDMKFWAREALNQFTLNDPKAALEWIVHKPTSELALITTGSDLLMAIGLGKLDTTAVLAAGKNMDPPQRDWLMTNHYAGRPLEDPYALLTEATEAIEDPRHLQMAVNHLFHRAIDEKREKELAAWIDAQPADKQAAFREKIANFEK